MDFCGISETRLRELAQADRMIGKEVWAQAKYLNIFQTKPSLIQRTTIHPDDSLEEDIPSEENIAALQSYEDQDFLALVYKLFPRRSRERRVLLALMRGESKPVIAAKLGCSRQTVYNISRAAWQKLQVEAEQEAQGR